MKKKVMMLIAVLGMAFAGQVDAQNNTKVMGAAGGSGQRLLAGDAWSTWFDYNDENGQNHYGCCGNPVNCIGGN